MQDAAAPNPKTPTVQSIEPACARTVVIMTHAQPTSSSPKPIAGSPRAGFMRNNISNGKSAGGVWLLHHNLGTTAAPTLMRKQPRDTEVGVHAQSSRQFSRAG